MDVLNDSPHMRVGGDKILAYSEALDTAWTAHGIIVNDPDAAVSMRDIVVRSRLHLPHDRESSSLAAEEAAGRRDNRGGVYKYVHQKI